MDGAQPGTQPTAQLEGMKPPASFCSWGVDYVLGAVNATPASGLWTAIHTHT